MLQVTLPQLFARRLARRLGSPLRRASCGKVNARRAGMRAERRRAEGVQLAEAFGSLGGVHTS